ncbi:hypothetical protein GLYMA_12G062150v4 [Glycine max]|nr:hypothetical protein GLYMA_12G062150v4 [Glycine max]KAH1141877.1 hypothetical protein GYH30_032867 [Glycine max]
MVKLVLLVILFDVLVPTCLTFSCCGEDCTKLYIKLLRKIMARLFG